MGFGGLLLTNQGRNSITAAIANETELKFTSVQIGDGNYHGSFTSKQSLTNRIAEIPITSVTRKENEVILECDWNSRQMPQGFYFREIGIIGNGVLCYYDNAGQDAEFIDPESDTVIKQRRLRFTLVISDEANISVNITSGLYALNEDLEEFKHQKGASYGLAELDKNGLVPFSQLPKHPAPYEPNICGLYKITTDGCGHVVEAVPVKKEDITRLGIPAQDTNTTYEPATASAAGLMSASDKKKMDELGNVYAKKSIYGDTAVSMGRESGTAVGTQSFAVGTRTIASEENAHAEGYQARAVGKYAFAMGCGVGSSNFGSHTIGKYNKATADGATSSTQVDDVFVVGNGTGYAATSNAFRVTYTGATYGKGAFNTSGADYAEFIKPWADGNNDNEDRVGYFVTVKDGFLHKANEGDHIVGITSGNPSIVGAADEDYYWRYARDDFNRIIMEDVTTKEGDIVPNARMKQADDYDPNLQGNYIERKDRKEWDYVGMLGVLPVRDDGTCLPNHYCKCGKNGIATLAKERGFDTYMVIERISDHVVSVIFT